MIRSTLKVVSILLVPVFVAGCELLNPPDGEMPSQELSDVYRIIWVLESYETDGTDHDIDDRQPPHLVFDTTTFFGDNGCRHFSASYTAADNHVVPEDFLIQTGHCEGAEVSIQPLTEPFDVKIGQNQLNIASMSGHFHYQSNYTKPIARSPLANETWKLVASDDPDVQALEGQFAPMLAFDAERTYNIRWRCTEDNLFGCNEFSGLWGVGPDNTLLLYHTASQVSNAQHARTISELQHVASYRLEAGDLILISGVDSSTHRFEKE